MGIYNKTGMMLAVASRWTRLDLKGRPKPGPKNRFYSDALVSMTFTPFYNKQDDITGLNGVGAACITYSPAKTLLRLDISDVTFCYPDPQATEFLSGGLVFENDDEDPVGYAAPSVGRDPKPEGVAMEMFAGQVQDGAIVGYFHFLLPRVRITHSKEQSLNATDFWQMGLEGVANENPFFGDGPGGEFEAWPTTSRVYQWQQIDELPAGLEYGYSAVPTPTGTDGP